MTTTLSTTRPVARKPHICDSCGGTIHKGERYLRQTIADGYIYDFICHEKCNEVFLLLDMAGQSCDGEVYAYDFACFVWEYLSEFPELYERRMTTEEAVDAALSKLKSEKP